MTDKKEPKKNQRKSREELRRIFLEKVNSPNPLGRAEVINVTPAWAESLRQKSRPQSDPSTEESSTQEGADVDRD